MKKLTLLAVTGFVFLAGCSPDKDAQVQEYWEGQTQALARRFGAAPKKLLQERLDKNKNLTPEQQAEIMKTFEEMKNAGNPRAVGADRDEHGCIGSAGYTFSTLKNECVRLWEEGFSLLPVGQEDYSLAAHGMMSEDHRQIELFVPGEKASVLLTRDGQEWKSEHTPWRLVRHPGKLMEQELWELFENDTLRYEARPVLLEPLD